MKTLTESILGSNGAGARVRAEKWCEENLILDQDNIYTISKTGVISGDIRFSLKSRNTTEIPDWIRWGEVHDFDFTFTRMKTCKNFPTRVTGNFTCVDGNATIKSLEGGPQFVGGGCIITNVGLKSLKGSPSFVGGSFDCTDNDLTSLEGCPQEVGSDFICSNNHLTSLEGCPKNVPGAFACSHNELKTLKGFPRTVGQGVYCDHNPGNFAKSDVKSICNVRGHIYVQ